MRIPAVARSLASVFEAAGRQCWLVGGAVRDLHLGHGSHQRKRAAHEWHAASQ